MNGEKNRWLADDVIEIEHILIRVDQTSAKASEYARLMRTYPKIVENYRVYFANYRDIHSAELESEQAQAQRIIDTSKITTMHRQAPPSRKTLGGEFASSNLFRALSILNKHVSETRRTRR